MKHGGCITTEEEFLSGNADASLFHGDSLTRDAAFAVVKPRQVREGGGRENMFTCGTRVTH